VVYILLENATNSSVFYYIHAREGLPEKIALRFFYQVALAIEYLHDQKIIHRDLKPENLLLDCDFNVKLCDFGWSCYLPDSEMRRSLCGTIEYMCPEILNNELYDESTDIWALGILLYEFLFGRIIRQPALSRSSYLRHDQPGAHESDTFPIPLESGSH
jgi:aurora kinase